MNKDEHPKYAFFQGKIQPIENAKVDIRTNALQYGTAVFEGIRSYFNESENNNYVFRLKDHYLRLFESAKIMMIDIKYSVDELCEITLELLRKEDYKEDSYIRPFAYNSGLSIGPKLIGNEQDLFIYSIPLGDYLDTAKGIKVCTSSWNRIPDNCIPPRAKIAGSYVNAALQKTEAILNGFDEAVVLTIEGQHVSEGSAMNIFMVKNNILITPEINNDILEGITRDTVLKIAEDELCLKTCMRAIDRTELYTADELFYCGTGAQIAPIGSVDGRKIADGNIGPLTKKIQDIYFNIVKNKIEKYVNWCTKV
jgi:branched-chain amino acid aminotransferase